MFMSLRKFARPLMPAALLASLAAELSPAQTPAAPIARTPAGRTLERVTADATVVSTAHYHATIVLSCNASTNCQGDFPLVAARRRLKVTRVSCNMHTATYSTFAVGALELVSNGTPIDMVQALPADYTTPAGYHSLNRAVDVQVAARQNVRVQLYIVNGGQTFDAACTAQGTLETLQ